MSAAQDEMAEAHRRDTAAETAFRRTQRDLDALLKEHGDRLGRTGYVALAVARDSLKEAADHIVAVWD